MKDWNIVQLLSSGKARGDGVFCNYKVTTEQRNTNYSEINSHQNVQNNKKALSNAMEIASIHYKTWSPNTHIPHKKLSSLPPISIICIKEFTLSFTKKKGDIHTTLEKIRLGKFICLVFARINKFTEGSLFILILFIWIIVPPCLRLCTLCRLFNKISFFLVEISQKIIQPNNFLPDTTPTGDITQNIITTYSSFTGKRIINLRFKPY